jgi:glycosyltransferase involved in cell wall biosynthesis
MTGYLPVDEIRRMWPDFDVAVHVPLSENCGGIGEPMLAKVPVIAGKVGGLPELIIDGVTGTLVPIRQPGELSSAILRVLSSPGEYSRLAANAFRLASGMAADRRLGEEVLDIYCRVLMPKSEPQKRFDPMAFLDAPVARADQAAL